MTRPANDWFADEAFWQTIYPFVFSENAQTAALTDVSAIRSLVGRPVTTVVDLRCGPGRHSVPFAKQGSRVTGVDGGPSLLGRAAMKARRHTRFAADGDWCDHEPPRLKPNR